jgi:F-type H+-transporting ATPase subunit epsilon
MGLQLNILTPDCVFCEITAEQLILPTSTGQIGVLTGHANLITAIDIGPIIVLRDSSWIALAVIGGFRWVKDDRVTVLVNDAVYASSVLKAEAEKSLEEAKNRLNNATDEDEKIAATFAFKRSRARYQIVC